MDQFSLDSASRRSGNRFRLSRSSRLWLAAGLSAAAAPFANATLSGSRLIDWVWSAALAAIGAVVASRTRRNWVVAASLAAALIARTAPSVAVAAVAVLSSIQSTRKFERRAVFARGIGGGGSVATLLFAGGEVPAVQLALASIAVTLLLGVSAWRRSSPLTRRRVALGAGGFLLAWTAATAVAALGLLANASRLDTGSSQLKLGLSAARLGNVELANAHFEAAHLAIRKARSDLDRYGWAAEGFPVVGQQVRATTEVLARVEGATGEARRAATLVADEALAVRAGTVDLDAIAGLDTPLSRLARSLTEVVDQVDEYDGAPLLPVLRDRLDELRTESARAASDARLGAQAASALPDALGASEDRRYLVLFTSPAEARGRFGFPGSFAEVTFSNGRFLLGEHGTTSALLMGYPFDQSRFDQLDESVRPYLAYGATRDFLSSTVPPDFTVVAENLREMWSQTGRGEIDGVLRFDPTSLAPLLTFTGPVLLDGLPAPLDASNLAEFLLLGQYTAFPDRTAPRRELLDEVATVTFERLETANLPNPRVLFDIFAPLVRSDHLQMTSFLPAASELFGEIEIDGRFRDLESDGLMVTTINGLGNKIDSFLSLDTAYRATVQGARLEGTVRIELTNAAPASGLANYVIGSFREPAPAPGTNRSTLLVYTSAPAESVLVNGQPVTAVSTATQGWWLHQLEVEIPPGATTTVEMQLAGDLADAPYRLWLPPAGGSRPAAFRADVTVDGRVVTYSGQPTGAMLLP